jgi:hypothetical protein
MSAATPTARGITATFRRNSAGQLVVSARGPGLVARALHPMARVGTVPVVGILCRRGVLTGRLEGTPRPGDELVVRYPPEPELRTGVRYASEAPLVS